MKEKKLFRVSEYMKVSISYTIEAYGEEEAINSIKDKPLNLNNADYVDHIGFDAEVLEYEGDDQ